MYRCTRVKGHRRGGTNEVSDEEEWLHGRLRLHMHWVSWEHVRHEQVCIKDLDGAADMVETRGRTGGVHHGGAGGRGRISCCGVAGEAVVDVVGLWGEVVLSGVVPNRPS